MAIRQLKKRYCGKELELEVCSSFNGYFIGTRDLDGTSRESVEYFSTNVKAETALKNNSWTQRDEP